jgi:eukaryotic-like serine/threonine-protein kinase
MPFSVDIADAQALYPKYRFIAALTPSEQKSAFHVKDVSSGEDLCFKIFHPLMDLQEVQREIDALTLVKHPNVVGMREYCCKATAGGAREHYVIEEFVAGEDLEKRLTGVAWDLKEAALFFEELCRGLAALSEHNIVHRDLKPTNIRVRSTGSPVIIDFGIARHLDKAALTQTVMGARKGTPAYFAPEQWRGNKYDIDRRTDLFAVGVLAYVATTGKHPFLTPSMTQHDELETAVCDKDDHLLMPEFVALPPKWKLIIQKLLGKERVYRPNDPVQVSQIFRNLGV